MDSTKRSILDRRAHFITVAAIALAAGASAACEIGPRDEQVCLSMPCDDGPDHLRAEVAVTSICVGGTTAIEAWLSGRCRSETNVTSEAVFATSDPAVLVCEKNVCRGRQAGAAKVIALHEGRESTPMAITVTHCDAGANDTSVVDSTPPDTAPSADANGTANDTATDTATDGTSTDGTTTDGTSTDGTTTDGTTTDGTTTDGTSTDAATADSPDAG